MQRPCQLCGGSGELRYFRGRSRFLLSERTCPLCDGLGAAEGEDPAARLATELQPRVPVDSREEDDEA